MQATVSSYNAGDKINITYKRDGKENTTTATLSSKTGTYEAVASNVGDKLGAELQTINKADAQKYDIGGGVLVKKIKAGGPFSKTKMEPNFIITSVNGYEINSVDELAQAIRQMRGESIQMEGIYPGYTGIYRYPLVQDEE